MKIRTTYSYYKNTLRSAAYLRVVCVWGGRRRGPEVLDSSQSPEPEKKRGFLKRKDVRNTRRVEIQNTYEIILANTDGFIGSSSSNNFPRRIQPSTGTTNIVKTILLFRKMSVLTLVSRVKRMFTTLFEQNCGNFFFFLEEIQRKWQQFLQ